MNPAATTLVTMTGHDRPGVTTRLFGAFADGDFAVLDVEQVVIRGQLVLGVLFNTGRAEEIRERLAPVAADLDMLLEVTEGDAETVRETEVHPSAVLTSPSSATRSLLPPWPASRGGLPAWVPTSTASSGSRPTR